MPDRADADPELFRDRRRRKSLGPELMCPLGRERGLCPTPASGHPLPPSAPLAHCRSSHAGR